MKFYPKRLNSLEELKREKQVLKYARKHSKPEGFMDMKIPSPSREADKQSDILSMAGDLLTSKSFADVALTVGLPLIKLVGRKTEKSFIKTFAGEVIGGYVKWKILQMGVRGVKLFVRMQQTKKEQRKAHNKEQKRKAQTAH
jgi:hypothetical protein